MKNESADLIKVKPQLDDKGRYGLVGDFMAKLSDSTEAIPEFMGAEVISFLSASINRGQVTTSFGATKTEPRCNALMVAGTGEGKGLSSKQFRAVKPFINDLQILSPEHSGGLSSSEGLVNSIRDDSEDSDGNIVEGVLDKRLFVTEEEFFNVIAKSKSGSSTLSSTIRCLFDGGELAPLTKFNRIGCKKPHVVIYAHVTPKELTEKLSFIEISNGFLNRFPIFYGVRQPDVPFPKCMREDVLEELAESLERVLIWCNEEKRELTYSDEYRKLWEENYSRLRNLGARGSIEADLLVRARHYTSMYAMIFAATDCSLVIEKHHLDAALAWIDYWQQSVKYIYNTEIQSVIANEKLQVSRAVYQGIVKCIRDNGGKPIGKTPLTKLFSGRFTAAQISESLKYMQELANPPIAVVLLPRNQHEISLRKRN
ncbi:hypothetical protein [Vibrio sp. 1S139]|uniref:hypothetical protein n=1 Tax=Vibrio sp. 1S139 TaxID=3230006 RepID=UPI00352BF001